MLNLDRYEEALKMWEEVLSLQRKILGEEHPDTITAMSNLAASLSELGRYQEAVKQYEEVLVCHVICLER
ncbi:tetratricopeptide repeat protein [Succiniclasticum ruminis]|uniref:tetratricopeptide repeat protein n=1 Tax=Succiniclasticum ruminis TaxID=40841 RepID=UPI00210F1613|nr:tetratricopeptide repeat protein [Succiniclasticum ruminis]